MLRSFIAVLLSLSVIWAAGAQDDVAKIRAAMAKAVQMQQKELQAALAAYRQAEQDAQQAPGDEAKQAALQNAKAALQKLSEAQKAASLAAAKAQEAVAAAQAAAIRAGGGRGGNERDTVNPEDPVERFALLTAGGPLVVQATLTIDGQPFRLGREKLIAEMIAGADADKDGQTTWKEAFSSGRFTFGRLGNLNEQTQASLIRTLDKDGNNQVDPGEARQFLAQFVQGPTFSLGGGGATAYRVVVAGFGMAPASGPADLLTLLDTDQSKSLDAKEIAAATARLKSRDADDNDVLDSAEITGAPASGAVRIALANGPTQATSAAVLLGPAAGAEAVLSALRQKYKTSAGKLAAGCFPQFPELFAALDKDSSGEIDAGEALGLNEVPPHLELNVDLPTQKIGSGMKVTALAAAVKNTQDGVENKVLELPGVRVTLAASVEAPPKADDLNRSIAMSTLTRLDKGGKGYLVASDLAGQPGQFDFFDENGDGKAYLAEIAAARARQSAPAATQFVANIVQQGNSLFQTLDANGDGRLGLREMRAAAERLTALDKDEDRTIAGNEIPETINVSFTLGIRNNGQVVERPLDASGSLIRSRPAGGPEWFTRMDRNADGDLTLKEFLGSAADFQRLDSNSDGLIDPQEAKAAGN